MHLRCMGCRSAHHLTRSPSILLSRRGTMSRARLWTCVRPTSPGSTHSLLGGDALLYAVLDHPGLGALLSTASPSRVPSRRGARCGRRPARACAGARFERVTGATYRDGGSTSPWVCAVDATEEHPLPRPATRPGSEGHWLARPAGGGRSSTSTPRTPGRSSSVSPTTDRPTESTPCAAWSTRSRWRSGT